MDYITKIETILICNNLRPNGTQIAQGPIWQFLPELFRFMLGFPRPSTEPRTPKPRKVSKEVSLERSLGTPSTPEPPKVPKTVQNAKKSTIVLTFRIGGIRGWGGGGPQTLLRRLFLDFWGFQGLGLCRRPVRSQDVWHFSPPWFNISDCLGEGGGLPTGWPGVKCLCAVCGTQGR